MNTNTICAADFPMEYETTDLRNPIVAKGLELWRFRIASSQMNPYVQILSSYIWLSIVGKQAPKRSVLHDMNPYCGLFLHRFLMTG